MDGIRAAQALRDMDLPILIVYISCHEEYLMDLFATEPFRFLHKPVNREELCRVFLDACRRIRRKAGYFTFSCQRTFHKIPYDGSCISRAGAGPYSSIPLGEKPQKLLSYGFMAK